MIVHYFPENRAPVEGETYLCGAPVITPEKASDEMKKCRKCSLLLAKCHRMVDVEIDVSPDEESVRHVIVRRYIPVCGKSVDRRRRKMGLTVCGECAAEQNLLAFHRPLGNGKLSDDRIKVSPALGGRAHFQPAGKPVVVTREAPHQFDTGRRPTHRTVGWLDPAPTRELHAVWDYWCVPRDFSPLPPKVQGFALPEDLRVATKGNIPDQPFDRPRRDNGPHFTAPTERDAVRSQRQRERNADHKRRTLSGDRLT